LGRGPQSNLRTGPLRSRDNGRTGTSGEVRGAECSFGHRLCHETQPKDDEEQHHIRYIEERAGLVDSASEENKARAVVEIYLEPGVIPTAGLHPLDATKTKIENQKAPFPMEMAITRRVLGAVWPKRLLD